MADGYRMFAVQRNFQFETHDKDGNLCSNETETEWRERVIKEWLALVGTVLECLVMIFHDRDINEDGTTKGLHVHAVLKFINQHSEKAAMKVLGASSVQNCKHVKSKVRAYRYLIHVSEDALNKKKTIYLPTDVFYWKYDKKSGEVIKMGAIDFQKLMSKKEKTEERQDIETARNICVADVMCGRATVSDIKERYKKDRFDCGWNHATFIEDKYLYERAHNDWLETITDYYSDTVNHSRCLTTIYISGLGGAGKSTLADAIAGAFMDAQGVHNVSAPGGGVTFDFAGDYKGQRVTVFNEFTSAFSLQQFLNVYDPIRVPIVSSRYHNKPWFPDYAILTTGASLESTLHSFWYPYAEQNVKLDADVRKRLKTEKASEKEWLISYERANREVADLIRQLRRRFAINIEFRQDLENKIMVDIYIRDDLYNVPHLYVYDIPPAGCSPFKLVQTLEYSKDKKSLSALVEAVKKAITYYYKYNKLAITPETVEKPVFE